MITKHSSRSQYSNGACFCCVLQEEEARKEAERFEKEDAERKVS